MRGLAVTVTTTDVLKTRAFCRFKNGEDFENRETLKHRAYVLEIEGLSKTAGCEEGPDEITCRWIFHDG